MCLSTAELSSLFMRLARKELAVEATTKRGPDLSYILGALGGFLGGIWLIVWPFISWPLGTGLPSLWDKGEAAAILDVIYGVLLILLTIGCIYGRGISLGSFTLRHISLYGVLLLSIALLVLPFILGTNPKLFGILAGGKNQDEYAFWNDIIVGTIALTFSLCYILPRPSYIIGALGGFLGGIWLIVWPFISWPPNSGLPSLWDKGEAAGIFDVIYGVLLILFILGCMYGWKISLGSFTLGHVSLYGLLLLSIALLVVPFILGNNPKLFGTIPAGKNQDEYAFWNDIITGAISLPYTMYYIIPRKPKVAAPSA
jgi:hypothetical protein